MVTFVSNVVLDINSIKATANQLILNQPIYPIASMHHRLITAIYVLMASMPNQVHAIKYHPIVKLITLPMANVLHAKISMYSAKVAVFSQQWV